MAKSNFFYCRKCPAATDHQHIIHTIPGQKRKRHEDVVWCSLRGGLRALVEAAGCEWVEDALLAAREELTQAVAAIDVMLPKLVDFEQWRREHEADDAPEDEHA